VDIEWVIEKKDDYLNMVIKGTYSSQQKELLLEALNEVMIATQKYNCFKILADLSALDMAMSIMDKYRHMAKIAEKMMHPRIKVAVLLTEGTTDFFGSTVAKNRGIHSETFTNRADALEWLL
jgi:hypothetical protein